MSVHADVCRGLGYFYPAGCKEEDEQFQNENDERDDDETEETT